MRSVPCLGWAALLALECSHAQSLVWGSVKRTVLCVGCAAPLLTEGFWRPGHCWQEKVRADCCTGRLIGAYFLRAAMTTSPRATTTPAPTSTSSPVTPVPTTRATTAPGEPARLAPFDLHAPPSRCRGWPLRTRVPGQAHSQAAGLSVCSSQAAFLEPKNTNPGKPSGCPAWTCTDLASVEARIAPHVLGCQGTPVCWPA